MTVMIMIMIRKVKPCDIFDHKDYDGDLYVDDSEGKTMSC